jgi:NtrC-family two-component system sensor histidine kinase KinB
MSLEAALGGTSLGPPALQEGERLELWADLAVALGSGTTIEARAAAACRAIAQGFGFSRVGISTVDRERKHLVTRAAHDPSLSGTLYRVLSNLWTQPLESDERGRLTVSVWCFERQEQVFVPDVARYDFRPDQTFQRGSVAKAMGIKGYLLTPIVASGTSIGVLAVGFKEEPRGITHELARRLRVVADYVGLGLAALPWAHMTEETIPAPLPVEELLEILREGVIIVGADGAVRHVNRAAQRLLQVDGSEAIGEPWHRILDLRERDRFATVLAESGKRAPARARRWTLRPPTGGDLDIELRLLPLTSSVGGRGTAIVIEDVTRRAELQRVRDQFTSMLVHDLRAPLQSVVGFSELLCDERLGPLNDDQKEFVGRIEHSGEQLMELIEDILEVARYEAGRPLMSKEAVAPWPLVEAVVQRLQGKALPMSVDLRNTVPHDMPDLYADPLRLTQVLQNLLDNAIDFSPSGGVVWVRAEEVRHGETSYVRFEIEDDGPGLGIEGAERLFEKFWVGESRAGRRSHGLGLVIARLIVEGHGGEIQAHDAERRGAVVSFTIPIYRESR